MGLLNATFGVGIYIASGHAVLISCYYYAVKSACVLKLRIEKTMMSAGDQQALSSKIKPQNR